MNASLSFILSSFSKWGQLCFCQHSWFWNKFQLLQACLRGKSGTFWKWHCHRIIALESKRLIHTLWTWCQITWRRIFYQWYSINNVVEITDQNRCILFGPPRIKQIIFFLHKFGHYAEKVVKISKFPAWNRPKDWNKPGDSQWRSYDFFRGGGGGWGPCYFVEGTRVYDFILHPFVSHQGWFVCLGHLGDHREFVGHVPPGHPIATPLAIRKVTGRQWEWDGYLNSSKSLETPVDLSYIT